MIDSSCHLRLDLEKELTNMIYLSGTATKQNCVLEPNHITWNQTRENQFPLLFSKVKAFFASTNFQN